MQEHPLDARGLMCPMPIIKLAKLIKGLPSGDVVRIEADDPAFCNDLRAWCSKTGHALVNLHEEPRGGVGLVRRA